VETGLITARLTKGMRVALSFALIYGEPICPYFAPMSWDIMIFQHAIDSCTEIAPRYQARQTGIFNANLERRLLAF